MYSLAKLAAGDYEVTVAAEGLAVKTENVKAAEGASLTFSAELTALPSAPEAQTQAPAINAPNAPPSNKAPSLEDLGFPAAEIKSNPKEQALLDKRTHMLKIHQRLGLITTIPMIASVATSINAGGRHTSNTDRTVHMVLGSATGDLYFMTAWYAIRAPRVEGTKSRGPIRFHKAMAWIHGPGMILTPILGALAYSQKNNGEKVHGIAKAHGPVAIVTAGAFGAALLSVSLLKVSTSGKFMNANRMTKQSASVFLLLLLTLPQCLLAADEQWVLDQSTLSYHVSHPLHQTEGVSHAARGKGLCHEGQCDFLIAVPVKSFDSGDSNRDLHMIQVTRGAEFPMVTVRTRLPESDSKSATINADLEIQFAGQTAHYKQVPFELTTQDKEAKITGTIPATLSDFKIEPPTLLTLPVKNEMPIRVEMNWHRQ